MSDALLRVHNVGKKFCRDFKKSLRYGLTDSLNDLVQCEPVTELRPGEFWANKGISFEVKRGECLGLIGRNGAGKTTLLKMLSGLIKPDTGQVTVRGRLGAMIALGAGFNPILSGRENIIVNASVLGLSKRQINDCLESIVDFSELGEFLDSPVQNYSSGMKVRLGFAIATTLQPDVLLLDEVLAVGDVAFRNKCYRRIDSLREKCAVVFVSHNIPSVSRISNKGMFLRKGEACFYGKTDEAITRYHAENSDSAGMQVTKDCFYPISDIKLMHMPEKIDFRKRVTCELIIYATDPVQSFSLHINVKDNAEQYLASCILPADLPGQDLKVGENRIRLDFNSIPLRPVRCGVSISIMDSNGALLANLTNGHEITVCGGSIACVAECQLDVAVRPSDRKITG